MDHGSNISRYLRGKISEGFASNADIIALKEQHSTYGRHLPQCVRLPDGTVVCADPDPQLVPISDHVFESVTDIMHIDLYDIQMELLSDVILTGGTSLMNGFPGVVQRGINKNLLAYGYSDGPRCNVVARPERDLSPWIGGSVLSSLSSFAENMSIKRACYEESGYIRIKEFLIDSVLSNKLGE